MDPSKTCARWVSPWARPLIHVHFNPCVALGHSLCPIQSPMLLLEANVEIAPASTFLFLSFGLSASPRKNNDVQQYMNIHHFEELMRIFQDEKRADSPGFDIDKVLGIMFYETINHVLWQQSLCSSVKFLGEYFAVR